MIHLKHLIESTLDELQITSGDAEETESTSIELIRKYGKSLIPDKILKSRPALQKKFSPALQKSILKNAVSIKNNLAVVEVNTPGPDVFLLLNFDNAVEDACLGVVRGFTYSSSIYGTNMFRVEWSFVIDEERGKGYASMIYNAIWSKYNGIISDTRLYTGSINLWKRFILKQAALTVAIVDIDQHDFDKSFVFVPFNETLFQNKKFINYGVYSLLAFKDTIPSKVSKFIQTVSKSDYVTGTLEIMYCAYSSLKSKDFTLDPNKPKNKVTIIELVENSKNGFDKTFIKNLFGTKNRVWPSSRNFRKTDFSKVKQICLMLDGNVIVITLKGKELEYAVIK